MAIVTATLPTIGDLNATEDADVRSALSALLTEVNGRLDAANLSPTAAIPYSKLSLASSLTKDDLATALAEALGVSSTATVRRGKSIIAAESAALTSTSYATLNTPDQVASIVLPTDGLFFVVFQGTWKSSVGGAGRAAIFLGSNQLQKAEAITGTNVVDETSSNATANRYVPLATAGGDGLLSYGTAAGTDYPGQVTTGQMVNYGAGSAGIPVLIFAAAGTYTVSIKFKSASGTVTAKERKLWVWGMGL